MTSDAVVKKLVDYVSFISFDRLLPEAVHEAGRRVLDTIGCAIAAFDAPPCRVAREFARLRYPFGPATLLGTDTRTTSDMAAFVNGTMARYLDYNDTYLSREPAHPSDNIPALLALCEAEGIGGKELVTAIVFAYEVQCRFCDAASLRTHGWDHVSYGPISTGIAAAYLLRLSPEEVSHAIALAVTPNLAIRQTRAGEISHWKAAAFANAARNGIFAAYLAKAGMQGPSDPFCGLFGFTTLVTGTIEFGDFGGENGMGFKITDSSIKYYPAEYHAQSAIDLALIMRDRIGDFSDIERIDVFTFRTAVEIIGSGEERWNPGSRETADHSLPYCVAAAILDGAIDIDSFRPERIERAVPLMRKIRIIEEEGYNELYPEGNPTRIRIILKHGHSFERELLYPRGHAENRMNDGEVIEKFKRLTPFPNERKEKIINMAMNMENSNPAELVGMLQLEGQGG